MAHNPPARPNKEPWISHGAFTRQQNQQVWNKQLPETWSEVNSAEGSSNITLWLQPTTQFQVHLCLKIATKAQRANNKDLFATAVTWTIKLIQKKKFTTLLSMTNGATASSACNKGQKLTRGTIEDQASAWKILEANILASIISKEERSSDFKVGWASPAACC